MNAQLSDLQIFLAFGEQNLYSRVTVADNVETYFKCNVSLNENSFKKLLKIRKGGYTQNMF